MLSCPTEIRGSFFVCFFRVTKLSAIVIPCIFCIALLRFGVVHWIACVAGLRIGTYITWEYNLRFHLKTNTLYREDVLREIMK